MDEATLNLTTSVDSWDQIISGLNSEFNMYKYYAISAQEAALKFEEILDLSMLFLNNFSLYGLLSDDYNLGNFNFVIIDTITLFWDKYTELDPTN